MAKEMICTECMHEWRLYQVSEVCPNCGSHETQDINDFVKQNPEEVTCVFGSSISQN